jgi:hypothetical protein
LSYKVLAGTARRTADRPHARRNGPRSRDLDGRPSAPDGLGEPESVHRTRHFDISEDHGDVAAALKQQVVGVRGLQNFEVGFLDHLDRGHPDQGFVFDDEDHMSCRCI